MKGLAKGIQNATMVNFYQKPLDTIIAFLKTSVQIALTDAESMSRLDKYGHNRIRENPL